MSFPVGTENMAASSTRMGDLGPRLASGVVMAALALATLYVGGDVFLAFWTLAGLAIVWEWQTLIDAPERPVRLGVGFVAVLAAAVAARQAAIDRAALALLVGAAITAWLGGPGKRLWAGGGVLYAGVLVVAVACLRLSLEGAQAILWLFALVWGTDTAAYVGGRLIGGPKLWPKVSPGKTRSGFLVGVSTGAILGIVALRLSGGLSQGAWPAIFLIGVCAAVLSQGGDLFESAVKRRFGVKDASHLIPGHGGVMDRLDGFIVAAVFIAAIGVLRAGALETAMGALRW